MSSLGIGLRSEMQAMCAELRGDFKNPRAEMTTRLDRFHAQFPKVSREQSEQTPPVSMPSKKVASRFAE